MIKNIIFDFDGVVLDSIPIKTEAFKRLFEHFPREDIDKLISYHLANGGMSRYEKIRYFFEELRHEPITEEEVGGYAQRFSALTKPILCNPKYLIADTLAFIQKNVNRYRMHIASGADDTDLKQICNALNIQKYFLSIDGAPKGKDEIVRDILSTNMYRCEETILIGDSINDYTAAKKNDLLFFGYNNENLRDKHLYIETFLDVPFE